MGLPSAINLRIAQVDPATLIPAASRTNDNSGAFEQHLDATDTPASRAADRRDDQRQRDTNSADNSQTSTQSGSSASNSGQDASATPTADQTAQTAQTGMEPTTGDTTAADANATSTAQSTDAAPATSDAETTGAGAEAGLVDAQATVAGDAGKTAKSHDDKAAKDKAPDQSGDTTLAALLAPQPVPLQQTPTTATSTPVQIAPASSPATPVPQPIAPEDAALAAAAAGQSASGDTATTADGDASTTGGDAGLAIKPKIEGLGHQAAASMAEKSSERDAASQTAQTATPQTANPQAVAAVETATTLAGNAGGAADDAGTQPVTATSGTLAAQLSDLQNAGTSQQSNANNTTIRIGTLPGQTTPSIVPSMAIALQIARNVQKGINRFDIRLDPPELGRIDVRMEVQRDGHVAAHLTVESAQTLDLLQRDQRALQQALTDAGLQANSDSLSFSLRDQSTGGGAQGSAGNGGGSGGGSEIAPIEETAASSTQIYNLNLSASGGVDIRV